MKAAMLALASAAALAACSTTLPAPQARLRCDHFPARGAAPGPAMVSADGVVLPIPADAVLYQDRTLERRIAVHALAAHPTAARTVRVAARLANCGTEDLQVRVRTNFLGPTFAAAEPNSAWQTVIVPGGGLVDYQELSLSTLPTHFLIEMDSPQ